jgi:aminoglycoside phosphotransferase (APT) family kinase protein
MQEKTDPVLDAAFVLELARRHRPGARAVTAVDESGGEARAYAIDDDIIVKVQRPHRLRPRTSLEKEAFVLQHLQASFRGQPLPVPRVHGYGREGLVEYICMSRVSGACASNVEIKGAGRIVMLKELGAVLQRLHGVSQAPLIQSGLFPGDSSRADLEKRLKAGLASAVEALPDAWPGGRSPEQIAETALKALPQGPPQLAVLHSNPGPSHTFVDPAGAKFSGLIDFGDAYISHPAFDLQRWPDPDDRTALFEGYRAAAAGVDSAFVKTWRIVSILNELQVGAWDPANREQAAAGIDQHLQLL